MYIRIADGLSTSFLYIPLLMLSIYIDKVEDKTFFQKHELPGMPKRKC